VDKRRTRWEAAITDALNPGIQEKRAEGENPTINVGVSSQNNSVDQQQLTYTLHRMRNIEREAPIGYEQRGCEHTQRMSSFLMVMFTTEVTLILEMPRRVHLTFDSVPRLTNRAREGRLRTR